MQVVTAMVLLADVLFKVGATLLTECWEHMLHRRVTQALGNGAHAGDLEAEGEALFEDASEVLESPGGGAAPRAP